MPVLYPCPLLPELPFLGHDRWTSATDSGLEAHRHAHWELTWIRSGSEDWWVEQHHGSPDEPCPPSVLTQPFPSPGTGAVVDEIGSGDCYLTRPNQVHGAVTGLLEPCELYWLHLDAERFAGLELAHAEALRQALAQAAEWRSFPGGDLLAAWEDLFAAAQGEGPLAALTARAALHRLLCLALAGGRWPGPSEVIRRALARAEGTGPVRLAALIRGSGLSAATFHERFHAEMGDSPASWLRRRRIREAKRLLACTERAVTAIAVDLYFSSSQHFATVFRRYTGLTPRQYRERVRRSE